MVEMTFIIEGTKYVANKESKEYKDISLDEICKFFYDDINSLEKLEIILEDGSHMILNSSILKKTIFLFKEV